MPQTSVRNTLPALLCTSAGPLGRLVRALSLTGITSAGSNFHALNTVMLGTWRLTPFLAVGRSRVMQLRGGPAPELSTAQWLTSVRWTPSERELTTPLPAIHIVDEPPPSCSSAECALSCWRKNAAISSQVMPMLADVRPSTTTR